VVRATEACPTVTARSAGARLKIPVRPPLFSGEEIADLDAEHLGDLLDVVEVEGDFSSYAPGDVHRRLADGRRHVGTCLHLAR
jgi:hypothetical protein